MIDDHDLFIFQDQPLGYVKPHFAGADDDDFQMKLLMLYNPEPGPLRQFRDLSLMVGLS